MSDRIHKVLEKGYNVFFHLILIGLFLRGEVFKINTDWFKVSFTSVKNFIPVFIVWWLLVRGKEKIKISLYLYMVLAAGIISTLFSINYTATLNADFVLIIYILWFYSAWYALRQEKNISDTIILFVLLAGVVNLADLYFHYSIGLREILEQYPFWEGKNALGLYLVMALCISCSIKWKRSWVWAGWINSVLLIPGIVFSYSRGAWIAGIVSVLGLFIFRFKRALGIIFVCIIILISISPEAVKDRFNDIFSKEDINIKQRLELWNNSIELIKCRPITGSGLGTFTEAYMNKYPNSFPKKGEGSRPIRHAHNLYIQILVETGILGLLVFVFLVLMGFIFGIKRIIREHDPFIKSIRYGCFLGVLAFLIYSITDCTVSWKFIGDSFSHLNLIWLLLWAILLHPVNNQIES